MRNVRFSIKNNKNILRAFLAEKILSKEDVDRGTIYHQNYHYQIVFDNLVEGIKILENLPCAVLVSFQTHIGGAAYAVIRLKKLAKPEATES
jgi:hypothetical protein